MVYQNGIAIAWGAWVSGTPVTVGVDDLAPGTYNFTIVAADAYGQVVQDTAWVAVLAPPAATPESPATTPATWTTTDTLLATVVGLLGMVGVVLAVTRLRSRPRPLPDLQGGRSPENLESGSPQFDMPENSSKESGE
jgi:hypothetical protein